MLPRSMADLEEHAFRRDKRFLVRLVLTLVVGLLVGIVLYMKLTSQSVGSCAADAFGEITEPADGND